MRRLREVPSSLMASLVASPHLFVMQVRTNSWLYNIIDVPEQVTNASILYLEIQADLKETFGGYDYISIATDSNYNQYQEYGLFVNWVNIRYFI